MDLFSKTRKEIGDMGERVAAEYLRRKGFDVQDRNVDKKTGEIDLIAKREGVLHFVEVKTVMVKELPGAREEGYDPSDNLHPKKIERVARTAEWYVAERDWDGEWQVDGILVWLRERDGMARVRYLPQVV